MTHLPFPPLIWRTLHPILLSLSLLAGSPRCLGARFDCLIRQAEIYDGQGGAPFTADLAIRADSIAAVGSLSNDSAQVEIDGRGLALAPGFINMLSWATESLIEDGRSQSNIRQGVTLEIFGEGESMGPLNETMKREMVLHQGDIKFPIRWTTLSEYLDFLVKKGVAPNVASFVGATTVRVHELGYADRPPTAAELDRMRLLVRQAMEEGALGLGSSLIYAPAFYAKTPELIALAKVASEHGGIYISHLRSEGTKLLEAADELITIAREAQIPAEIYHLKAAGRANWPKLAPLIERIEAARKAGLSITADMYLYTAGATGLDAAMPPWAQEGGLEAWITRLRNPELRKKIQEEMARPTDAWENFFVAAGSPTNIVLVGFKNEKLKPLTGQTLARIAADRGQSPAETAMDLVIEDGSRVETVYFLMSEENVRREVSLPWVSFGSDAPSLAPAGVFLKANPHPRAYGNFARLLGKYVRQEKVVPLSEAIRRLSGLPAATLKLDRRGLIKEGYFADLVLFDAAKVQDHATFERPHQYATGVQHVFVNGTQVLKNGVHTGALPGRVVRGRGWKPPAL